MSNASQEDRNKTQAPPKQTTVILLLTDIADTTWRMFLPTIGLGALGFWADTSWDTEPWLAILGVIIGAMLSAALIRQQLEKVKR
jgi:hypothetical protein